jgi:ribosome maturation factor RimP
MENQEILNRINEIVEPILKTHDIEIIEVMFHSRGRECRLQILVDKPEGRITVGECARLNREIGYSLDTCNLIDRPYLLEVSSPGLDRPLKTEQDFRRVKGELLKVVASVPLAESVDERIPVNLIGTLLEVGEKGIVVEEEEEGGKRWEISFWQIVKCVREIRF